MKRTVVVGATGAIGRVVVSRLVEEGHDVLAVARTRTSLEELASEHDHITACPADVTEQAGAVAVLRALGEERIRMLVHGASAPLGGNILETEPETIVRAVEVKVNGLLRLVRVLRDRFERDARIVAIGGNLGFDPVPDSSTAGIANAGQANAIRQLNRILAPSGITCHVVAPGPVLTPRYRVLAEEEARRRGVAVDDVIRRAGEQAPLGRLTRPEEVAWAVCRLADPEAAAAAGSTILLDAGRRTGIP